MVEVKAAGIDLSESHLRQATNYAANQGIEWVVLTNSIDWRLYRMKFGQPIESEEVAAISLLNINVKNEEDQRRLFLFCREGISSDAMAVYHQHTQLVNKFTVAQVVLSEPVVSVIRRELRRLFPELRVENESIADLLFNEVLKRELVEGDKAKETQQRFKKVAAKLARAAEKKSLVPPAPTDPAISSP